MRVDAGQLPRHEHACTPGEEGASSADPEADDAVWCGKESAEV
ncbi:hypothetical protein [Promicromonospora aerolata]|uniref:Uncharacterized protein n=1 Tax=Promicromonospora aerolata TaxID=195749 RepID=A0ABW4V2W5_9MICO